VPTLAARSFAMSRGPSDVHSVGPHNVRMRAIRLFAERADAHALHRTATTQRGPPADRPRVVLRVDVDARVGERTEQIFEQRDRLAAVDLRLATTDHGSWSI